MDIPNPLLIGLIAFAGSLTQSFAGFGVGLVAMPLLIALMGIRGAVPLGAVIILTVVLVTLLRYRRHLDLRAVAPLWLTSVVGIPIGVFALSHGSERVLVVIFGMLVIAYAIYAIRTPNLPVIKSPVWAPLFGLIAGFCTGAYNGSGPPVIVYATCRRWEPDQFRSNLQAFFIINTGTVNLVHLIYGHFTPTVVTSYFASLPGIALGILAGFGLARRFSPEQFRRVVLWLLLFLGIGVLI